MYKKFKMLVFKKWIVSFDLQIYFTFKSNSGSVMSTSAIGSYSLTFSSNY